VRRGVQGDTPKLQRLIFGLAVVRGGHIGAGWGSTQQAALAAGNHAGGVLLQHSQVTSMAAAAADTRRALSTMQICASPQLIKPLLCPMQVDNGRCLLPLQP
jgi:hypothetical protein